MSVKEFLKSLGKKELPNYPGGNFQEKVQKMREVASDPVSTKKLAGESAIIQRFEDYQKLAVELRYIQSKGKVDFTEASTLAQRVLIGKPVYFAGKDNNGELASFSLINYTNENDEMCFCAVANSGYSNQDHSEFIVPLSEEDDKIEGSELGVIDTLAFEKLNQDNLPDMFDIK